MIEELRRGLVQLEVLLESKADEIANKFATEQLKAYFRTKDAIRLLIPSLYDLEVALYKNKIVM